MEIVKQYLRKIGIQPKKVRELSENKMILIGREIFLAGKDMSSNLEGLKAVGLRIGKLAVSGRASGSGSRHTSGEKNNFRPSPAFIGLCSRYSGEKIYLNPKGEWLFLCGRDVFSQSIGKKSGRLKGYVFVQNEHGENLGLGKVLAPLDKKNRPVVRNMVDKGDYLRREMR